jgi:ABC-2 type transport system permease protein
MSNWPARLEVARWEFQRFVKPNQLFVTFVITLLVGGLGYGMAKLAARSEARVSRVAVVGGGHLGIAGVDTVARIELAAADVSALDSLRQQLTARKLEGILILVSADSARLIVRRNPVWKNALDTHLAALRQRLRLQAAGLAPSTLASMLAPVSVVTEFQAGNDGRAARIAAIIAIALVLYGVFTSMAYMMVSVTAEKQLRVTEQVVSAITPQTWIDGKILGIAAVALVSVLLMVVGTMVWILGRSLATGTAFSMGSIDPLAMMWIILFAMLGFVFWLAAFGAIAATIDDPNTSTRGPLMFVPAMFSAAGFMIVRNPDSTFARIAGLLPVTSPAVMPARVALSEVPVWELVLSAAILTAGIFLARRAAGKIFAVGMLLYGKEPSWREIRRWVRDSD